MDQTATSPLPFKSYTLEQVRGVCEIDRLADLDWYHNEDGSQNCAIPRILVRMPDPQLDIVVQTNDPVRGTFHAFPAADWRHVDHPAQEEFGVIRRRLNHALNELERTIKNAETFHFIPHIAYTLGEDIRRATELANFKVHHFDSDIEAFRRFNSEVEPLATKLEDLGTLYENSQGMLDLAHQLRKTIQQFKDFEEPLQQLRNANAELLPALKQAAEYHKTGETHLAHTSHKELKELDISLCNNERRIGHSLSQKLVETVDDTNRSVQTAELSLGLSEPVTDALRKAIASARTNLVWQKPHQKLNALLDAVTNMKMNELTAQNTTPPDGKGGSWRERHGKQPPIKPVAERKRDDHTGHDR